LSENIPFCVAAARKLPFPDNHFDLVTLFENIYGHITPKASRLEALAEIRRVLKPNGLVFIEATSIREVFRYWLAIRIMDVLHYFRNPYCLDFGDKLGAGAKQVNMPLAELPRTHWFPPHEIDEEVQTAALEVVQATTVQGFLANPEANAKSYHGKGRLLYVIRKPAA
jgi:SAM-dependent methyltransferase